MAISLAIRAADGDANLRAQIAATLRELLALQLARAPEFVSEEGDEDLEDEDREEEDFDEDEDLQDEPEEEFGDEPEGDAEAEEDLAAEDEDREGDEPAAGPGSADDYFQTTTSLVIDLATLADPQGRDLIRDAYQADIVDRWMIEEEDVDRYYAAGGEMFKTPDLRTPLEVYREHYEEHQAAMKRTPLQLSAPLPPPPPVRGTANEFEEPTPQPFLHIDRKPGRNEPCWCGSGKKYKKCHMRQDLK
jgi:hypothetical protein